MGGNSRLRIRALVAILWNSLHYRILKIKDMKKLFIFLPVVLVLFTLKARACSCNYGGPFLKVAPTTPFVAVVKVTKYLTFKDIYAEKTPMSMEVEIIEIYKGSESRKKITVWGDPGNLCRPYLSTFKEGQYYVIAFDPTSPNIDRQKHEQATDYTISICGAYWLTVNFEKKTATGDIDSKNKKTQTWSLAALKSGLDQGNNK